ncbi:MAG TPA: hypothetical protein VFF33_03335 [Ignavibacteriaceae bacterium]|nr:hypothetical protein [Ignavibacteriaceae bacterium]
MLKKIHIILVIAVLIGGFLSQVIYGFVWKSKTDDEISLLKEKIRRIEMMNSQDHESIIEIKLNLKNFIISQGLKYVES